MAQAKDEFYGSLLPERATAGFDSAFLTLPTLTPEEEAKQQANLERDQLHERDLIIATFTQGAGPELLALWSDYALLRPSIGEDAQMTEGKKNHIRSIILCVRAHERGDYDRSG